MKFNQLIIFGLGFLLFLSACSDIIEDSIQDKKVILESPADNYASSSFTQNFWWDKLDGATIYNFQVVEGKFDAVISLRLDTNTTKNKFALSLKPGNYEWRVRAENGSSKTDYITRQFIINKSVFIDQEVNLLSPQDDSATLVSTLTFSWEELYGATKYKFQIDYDTIVFSTSKPLYEYTTNKLSLKYTFPRESVYHWRVTGISDSTESQPSNEYQITYDKTPPDSVSKNFPANGAVSQTIPLTFTWKAVTGAAKYNVYLYKGSVNAVPETASVTTNSYQFNSSNLSGKQIFWNVTAVDNAGNESGKSIIPWNFTLSK